MNHDCTQLDWKPVLLVKVTRLPFGDTHTVLSVKRLYLAQHPDGILRADWTLPADERFLPLVQLTGWKPERDVPFVLPVQYLRGSSSHSAAVISIGTWVLPYDDTHYQLYERVRLTMPCWSRCIRLRRTAEPCEHSPAGLRNIAPHSTEALFILGGHMRRIT